MRASRPNYDIEMQSMPAGAVRFAPVTEEGRRILVRAEVIMQDEQSAATYRQILIEQNPNVFIRRP